MGIQVFEAGYVLKYIYIESYFHIAGSIFHRRLP